jgi:hypothetical protein
MRLRFRCFGQTDQYFKICRRILRERSRGPEGGKLGLQQIRNAIYRGFGFNSFSECQKVFVPDERISSWFHSKGQLNEAFSVAFEGAIEVARVRGFEMTVATAELIRLAIDRASEVNERALRRIIDLHSPTG